MESEKSSKIPDATARELDLIIQLAIRGQRIVSGLADQANDMPGPAVIDLARLYTIFGQINARADCARRGRPYE